MHRREKAWEDTGQIHKGCRQADIRDVRDPRLICPGQPSLSQQIGIGLIAMRRVGSHHTVAPQVTQQGLLPHHTQDPFVIDLPALTMQRMRHAAVAIAGKLQHHLLNGVP
jgi:hypothetical protein